MTLAKTGSQYKEFKVVKSEEIAELKCHLTELVHLPTGAQVMHIGNDDPENLFCLTFQTIPESSNGVAHILEHTVLCGSKKYPLKDPFFSMTRRSLNTFMNAMTGSDFTCYPASSQIPQDFYNLLEVYLDAVFDPLLTEMSFFQEGCRPALSQNENVDSPLEYKGIVINEMKGVMASSDARLSEAMGAALFPDTVYGLNSGGDPAVIPSLTYAELKKFHEDHYHPSRCLFFFYGNLPLEQHLDFISEHALKNVSPKSPLPPVQRQKRFLEPKRIVSSYPTSPERQTDEHAILSFGWLTCDQSDQQDLLGLCLVDSILMDTDASLLKRQLLESGLCKQASLSLDIEMAEIPAVLTLKGCKAENADAVEALLIKSLEAIADKGIPADLVQNALHQIEFYRTEITGNSAPYGLSLFMRSALARFHGTSPEENLKIHSLFERFNQTLEKHPDYLSDLIRKYFIHNPHRVRIILMPDAKLAADELEKEKACLLQERHKLNAAGLAELQKQGKILEEYQNEEEDEEKENCLPCICRKDVPLESRHYAVTHQKVQDLNVYYHEAFTNGITYAAINFPLPNLVQEELSLVRLLTLLIPQLGFGNKSFSQSLDYLQAYTGGLSLSLNLNTQARDPKIYDPTLMISGKALHRNAEKLFHAYRDMIVHVDFQDKARLKEVILKHYISLESSLERSALRYATHLSALGTDIAAQISNDWYGWNYFRWLRELKQNIDTRLESLVGELQELHARLLGLKNSDLILTCDSDQYTHLLQAGFYGILEHSKKPFEPWIGNYPLVSAKREGYCIASPVAFLARVCQTPSYSHPDSPAITAACQLFDRLDLHPLIREQGGAYGGGSTSSPLSGHLSFFSYRDPNIASSLQAFQKAIATVTNRDFGNQELDEAILEVIQDCDAPIAPGSRGLVAYTWYKEGRTPELRQAFRNQLLKLSTEDVAAAVARHLPAAYESSVPVVFAGRELLERENCLLEELGIEPFVPMAL